MSKASNKKPDGSPAPPLRSNKSADIIRKKIQQRYLVEASRLFLESAPDIEKNERDTLGEQIPTLIEQAEKYFLEGEVHEKERELELARKKYEKVKTIAIDYPGLSKAFRRVDDASELIWALQNRANRRMNSKGKQSVSMTTASKARNSRLWRYLIVCFFLQLIIIGAGLLYTDNLNFLVKKQNDSQPVAPHDENKQSEPPQKSVVHKELMDKQQNPAAQIPATNQKESLPPVRVSSSLQTDYKKEDTATSRKTSPQLQEKVTKSLTGTDSGQPRQTIPLTQQQKEPATILPGRTTSAEYFYRVQSNDTLGLISQKEYGTSSKWPTIANANKDQLGDNPNRLRVGMILVIPTLNEPGKTLLRSGPPGSLQER